MLSIDAGQLPTNAEPHGDIPSSAAPPLYYVVLDIETQKLASELPDGWAGMRKGDGLLSSACLYDSETNWTYYYSPNEAGKLADDLEQSGIVVSYNGKGFDIPAIEGMLKRSLNIDTHIDLLDMMVASVGNGGPKPHAGLSLANVSKYTLGQDKAGSAIMAPDMYKEAVRGGNEGLDTYIRLLNYNGVDVRLTRDLLLFAQKHGFLVGPHGPIHLTLPDWFRRLT